MLFAFAQPLLSQRPPGPPPHGKPHPGPPPSGSRAEVLGNSFFPPEMVMRHQNDISLSEEQRKFIIAQVQDAQKNFTEWQWNLEAEMEKMNKLTEGEKVEEAQALVQLDKVLALEKQIKTQQLKLMISIKNKLTPEQQKKLQSIKEEHRKNNDEPKADKK